MVLGISLSQQAQNLSRLTSEYDRLLEAFSSSLCGRWKVGDSQSGKFRWRYFLSDVDLPSQGWKIHVSITAAEAASFINQVLPYLVELNASFKLPVDLEGFVHLNSGDTGSTQVGKTLTVYAVNDVMCRSICLGINERWCSDRSPVVPFDLRLDSRSSVYVRYGAITSQDVVIDARGKYVPAICNPDGMLVEDRRDDPLGMPAWIPVPPVDCTFNSQHLCSEVRVGKSIYFPLQTIQSRAKGAIFLGVCGSTASSVIIKMSHRGVDSDLLGFDATDRLSNEFKILTSLHNSGIIGLAPAPIGLETGSLSVLISEDIPGTPLHHLHHLDWNEKVRGIIALMRAVSKLHSLGFLHRDIKLSNAILVGHEVRLIDFELACKLGETSPLLGCTRSYRPPEDSLLLPPNVATDCYALGIALLHVIFGYDPARLPLGRGRLIGLLHLIGAQDYIGLVSSLTAYIPSHRPTADVAANTLEAIGVSIPQPIPTLPSRIQSHRRWIVRAASESVRSAAAFLIQERGLYSWRNEHLFSHHCCEGINLGSAGIILGLATIATSLGHHGLTENIGSSVKWLANRDPLHEAHGLFTGNAGVALAMCVGAGFTQDCDWIRAKALERLTVAAQGVAEVDLFNGSAGVILAGCLIAEIMGDPYPLELVSHLATKLIRSPKHFGDLIAWENSESQGELAKSSVGAAHGTAGIALSLAVWGRATSNRTALTLAREVFLNLYHSARSVDRKSLRYQIDVSASPAPSGIWCHGSSGYLWCMLYAFGDDSHLSEPIDWAVNAFDGASLIQNPTLCHGLAGQLELCRMLRTVPRHRTFADRRAARVVTTLRLLQQRRDGLILWSSEEPDVFTPDLWVGFLGPAAILSMDMTSGNDALLSGHWLRQCSQFAYRRS